nr:T9SS type A sorting domain-containing protein [Candidatus Cloacimonadota bacterium]
PSTNIEFGVKKGEIGYLTIYNVLGQKMINKKFEEGYYTYTWDASKYASGIYFYKLQTPSQYKVNKMIMLK